MAGHKKNPLRRFSFERVLCWERGRPARFARRPRMQSSSHNSNERSRNALVMTDTELKVMAALAIMGLSNSPMIG